MLLTRSQILELGRGRKIKLKAVRGKNKGTEVNVDKLAGAVALILNGNPEGISNSQVYTKILESDMNKKYGRSISKNMVAARVQKLWAIGHVHRREEPIIVDGVEEPRFRYIYYQGEEEGMGETERAFVLSGKYTRRSVDTMFRKAYTMHEPQNRFQEAIFDLMSDTTDMQFPISLKDYKEAIAVSFTEEIHREDRLSQLCQWAREAYTHEQLVSAPKEFVIEEARRYAKVLWQAIEDQMKAEERLAQNIAESPLPFNQDAAAEFEKKFKKNNPDYFKSVRQLKKEGKI